MKTLSITLVVLLAMLASTAMSQTAQLNGRTYIKIDDSWYLKLKDSLIPVDAKFITVKFKNNARASEISDLNELRGTTYWYRNKFGYVDLRLAEGTDPITAVQLYGQSTIVEYVQPNIMAEAYSTPNDPRFNDQWYHQKIRSEETWNLTRGNDDVLIAIIDSGIELSHEDLVDNIWVNPGEDLNGNGIIETNEINGIDDDDFDGDPSTFVDDFSRD